MNEAMKVNISKDYPVKLVDALKLLHSMKEGDKFQFQWGSKLTVKDSFDTVVLLFDRGKKKLEISTLKYKEAGFRVFALKVSPTVNLDTFELSLTVLSLWRIIFERIANSENASVFTYKYGSKKFRLNEARKSEYDSSLKIPNGIK